LTMIPIQLKCIDFPMLTDEETLWIDSYHAEIRKKVLPLVKSARAKAWLERNTVACSTFRESMDSTNEAL
jgi:Xaa-Pro aminopeptidase